MSDFFFLPNKVGGPALDNDLASSSIIMGKSIRPGLASLYSQRAREEEEAEEEKEKQHQV